MNKQSIVLSLATVITGTLMFAPSVFADTCTTQYGGTTTCQATDLVINKQVENPVTRGFVENLTTTDPTFTPGSLVTYKLTITNNSGETFNPVNVKDILPPFMTFFAGPGTFDANSNSVSFQLANVIAGQTITEQIVLKVMDASQFPAGKSLFCVNNVAQVSALNRFDSDSAQVCLQNGTVVSSTLPVAGFDDFAMLLPFAGVGLGGFALLKGKKRG
ncbi:MAG TPA: hypothetical protein VMR81_04700 [Patescibacteria group bacterium]|jgi:uncharacterized repeat protein (TIGR01451 family)|nr:hypothetical protein [Patescibacteria group bacterium]